MRSPLLKRLPRELKSELGKYIAIFLFMTLTIGFISGFLVAGSSMKKTYDDSFEKYNIEKTSNNTVVINVETKAAAPTPKPTVNNGNSNNNSTITADSSKLIVLDAGHGGSDSGAVGYSNGNVVLEKNLTLEITYKVKEILENAGYTVSMTRTGDTLPSLVERPTQANAENAAVFVSIHINSVDNAPNANGTEVYYADSNNGNAYGTTSEKLATNILNRMLYYMGSTNRGVKTAEHAVVREVEEELNITPKIIRPLWLNQSFFTEDVDKLNYHEICIYYLMDISGTGLLEKGERFTLHEGHHIHDFEWLAFERLQDEYFYPIFLKTNIYNLPKQFTIRTEYE